jgi:hypothetical protein
MSSPPLDCAVAPSSSVAPPLLPLQVNSETRLDDRDRLTTVVKRQRRYLGSVSIPFFELYANGTPACIPLPVFPTPHPRPCMHLRFTPDPPTGGSILGELRVDAPAVLLGYRVPGLIHVGATTAGGPPGGATLASGGMPSPQRGGVMGGVPGGGTPFAAADSGAVVGLLAQAQANPRSTHMFVHVSVDPPLPRPSDDTDSGGGGGGGDASDLTAGITGVSSKALAAAIAARPVVAEAGRESRALLHYAAQWAARHAKNGRYRGAHDAGGRPRNVRALVQVCGQVQDWGCPRAGA